VKGRHSGLSGPNARTPLALAYACSGELGEVYFAMRHSREVCLGIQVAAQGARIAAAMWRAGNAWARPFVLVEGHDVELYVSCG